jgi:hypothetical protein
VVAEKVLFDPLIPLNFPSGCRRFALGALFRSVVGRSFFYLMRGRAYTQRPLLVGGDYRDTGMHRTYDLALRFGVDPVRKLGQLFGEVVEDDAKN